MNIQTHILGFISVILLFLSFFLGGCSLPTPRELDQVLDGVKGDATYSYTGILGSTTAIADGYSNGPDKAKANRLYFTKTFPWGSSVTLDIKDYERAKASTSVPAGPHGEASGAASVPGVRPASPETAGAPLSSTPVEGTVPSRVLAISPGVSGVGDSLSPAASGKVPARGPNLVGKAKPRAAAGEPSSP